MYQYELNNKGEMKDMENLLNTKRNEANDWKRCYYIDWLRIIGILSVFFFHNLRIFDNFFFSLKNRETSLFATVLAVYFNLWIMPLLFLLAGASSKFSLLTRTTGQYAAERFKRLVIPFVFGVMTMIPPQRYIEYLSQEKFMGTFSEFIVWYFDSNLFFTNFSFDPQWFFKIGMHLWFLAVLLLFSFAGIPIFTCLRSQKGKLFIKKLAYIAEKPGGIFIFCIPLIIIRITLQPIFNAYTSWSDSAFWFLMFIYGFIMVSDNRFTERANNNKYLALFIAVSGLVAVLSCYALGYAGHWMEYPDYSAGAMLFHALWGIIVWSMLVFFLGVGKAYLNKEHRFLGLLNDTIMPFYMLHYSVMLFLGFQIISWDVSITEKFWANSLLSLFVTYGLCYLIMTKLFWLRVLLGMKPIKSVRMVFQKSHR